MTLTKRFSMITIGIVFLIGTGLVINDALARIGRPRTPASYAGVARRTARRQIRRSSTYVATLPRGCGTVVINGMALRRCGSTYYQPYGSKYVVVYID